MKLENRVYRNLLQVPAGKIVTYGDLGKSVGLKNGQRKIGQIMKNNPFPIIIPCHRVVKSDGTVGGYAFGVERKITLLSKEGVKISKGKILDYEDRKFFF